METSSNSDLNVDDYDSDDDSDTNTQSHNLVENLEAQLGEIEMLQSIYSKPGEFQLFDQSILESVSNFIANPSLHLPNHIDFTIHLKIDELNLQVCINLAHRYPCVKPDVFVRSDQMTRQCQTKFNMELNNYITCLERGEVCLYSIVDWIQDSVGTIYLQGKKVEDEMEADSKVENNKGDSFSRYWIYSHHIYSKIKRKAMLDLAADLNITGFSLPGKPGIVCIEGASSDCEDWWHRIRSMTWKRIMCKKIEEYRVSDVQKIETYRKFDNFKEISFVSSKSSMKQDFHMDMGEFYKYLREKQCAYMFKEYFGFDGKS